MSTGKSIEAGAALHLKLLDEIRPRAAATSNGRRQFPKLSRCVLVISDIPKQVKLDF
jgi:hypothetical protein